MSLPARAHHSEGPWLRQDFQRVWQPLSGADASRLALVWEHEELLKLNSTILAFLKDQVCPAASSRHLGRAPTLSSPWKPGNKSPFLFLPHADCQRHDVQSEWLTRPDDFGSGDLLTGAHAGMQAAQAAGKWFASMVAAGIVAAVALPMTALSATSLIDMQWNVVRPRMCNAASPSSPLAMAPHCK